MRVFILLFYISICHALFQARAQAQLLDNNFLMQVKQIDEFIDRFNNSPNAYRNYALISKNSKAKIDNLSKTLYGSESADRISMVLLLFDFDIVEKIGRDKVKKFVLQVTDSTSGHELNFYEGNWYAVVTVEVLYKGAKQKVDLVFKNYVPEETKPMSFWSAVAGRAEFLRPKPNQNQRIGINPGSHGVNFVPLISALENSRNFSNVLSPDFAYDDISLIAYAANEGYLTFQHVREVKYHFLQVDNWVFTVEYFNRNDANSGWLISNLIESNPAQKKVYEQKILGIR